MRITNFRILQNINELNSLVKASDINFSLILSALNGNVDFIDNCSVSLLDVKFLKANTQYSFPHKLGRVPQGYFSVGMNVNSVIFNGTNTNDIKLIYLQASSVSSGKVLVF